MKRTKMVLIALKDAWKNRSKGDFHPAMVFILIMAIVDDLKGVKGGKEEKADETLKSS